MSINQATSQGLGPLVKQRLPGEAQVSAICQSSTNLALSALPVESQLDRELARFIYVREVKRFDPFKFSIYAWCIKIAIAGSLAPVRLAWVPFLRVPKNGFIYVEVDTKKLYAGL